MSNQNNSAELDGTQTLAEARHAHAEAIRWAELKRDGLIDRLGVWGPLVIPLIPAALSLTAIGKNYAELLHFSPFMSWPVGVISGAGIEVFGIVANENYLDMQRYNQTLAPGEERAPEEEARKARNTYMGIVIGLMTTLEVVPSLVNVLDGPTVIATVSVLASLFPLVFLAVLAGQVVIMRKQHAARVARRHEREEAEQGRDDEIEQLNMFNAQMLERLSMFNKRIEHAEEKTAEQLNMFNGDRLNMQAQIANLIEQIEALHIEHVQPIVQPTSSMPRTKSAKRVEHVQRIEQSVIEHRPIEQVEHVQPIGIEQPKLSKAERQAQLLHILTTELNNSPSDELNKSALGDRLGVKHTTINRDIDELSAAGRLAVNGHIEVMG